MKNMVSAFFACNSCYRLHFIFHLIAIINTYLYFEYLITTRSWKEVRDKILHSKVHSQSRYWKGIDRRWSEEVSKCTSKLCFCPTNKIVSQSIFRIALTWTQPVQKWEVNNKVGNKDVRKLKDRDILSLSPNWNTEGSLWFFFTLRTHKHWKKPHPVLFSTGRSPETQQNLHPWRHSKVI